MRYLRTSFYGGISHPPVTVVVSEADVIDTLESARQGFLHERGFYTFEIAEESDDLVEATAAMIGRIDAERERNMATLYFWNRELMPKMRKGGVIVPNPNAPDYPAPLDRDDIVAVFEQLALDPAVKPSVTVVSHGQDGSRVKLQHGKVNDA